MRRLFRATAGAIQWGLDSLLPRRERTLRIEEYAPEDLPVAAVQHEAAGAAITTLLSYRRQAAEDAIRALKYDGSRHAARLLSGVLADYLREEIASIRSFSQRQIVLVPVPLHKERERERGFNQIELVLGELPPEFRDGTLARIGREMLIRTRATQAQTRLTRAERLTNVADAFAAADARTLLDMHIFLVDDVTTTGATLAAAGKPLASLGASVTLLALARA